MTHHTFDFVCDGAQVVRTSLDECDRMIVSGPWALASNVKQAWLEIRKNGWREATWKGKARHLCPACWAQYLEERR